MLRLTRAVEETVPRHHVVNILVAEAAVRRLACRPCGLAPLPQHYRLRRRRRPVHDIERAAVQAVLIADLDVAGTAAGTSAATVIEMTPATDRAA